VFGSKFSDVSFDTSFLFGGKAGLFFDPSILGGNLGLELEVYHFQPDVGEQVVHGMFPGFTGPATVGSKDVYVTVVGLNAPLPAVPRNGRRRLHRAPQDLDECAERAETVSDCDVKPGFQATVGTRFFLTPHLALFTEYEYTHTADFNFNLISSPGTIAGNPSFAATTSSST
jgi:opacity protein-like surface antigen